MKILIKFENNCICFFNYDDYKLAEISKTNILDLNEIALSDEFINENYQFIFNFIRKNILKYHIHKIYLDKAEINEKVFNLINNISELNYLYINEEKKVDISEFNYILNNKNIKILNCYDINEITFNRLNLSRKIHLITRKKICNDTYIYRINNIQSYSDLYYKTNLTIDKLLNKTDYNTLIDFFKVNKYLKVICIKYYDQNMINKLLNILKIENKKNIRIEIIENEANIKNVIKSFDKLKDKNKKILKHNKIIIKIKYEDKYIKNNIFKEFNINILKNTLLCLIFLSILLMVLINIINKKNINDIKNTNSKIKNIITSIENNPNNINDSKKIDEKIENKPDIQTEKPKPKSAYFKNYTKAISELKKINNDTVGWLKINNLNIDYPVVKTNDNDKYLNYSFENKKNLNGWIFMDYRNNPSNLDKNTIIYGHSGNYYVMFGSLYKVLSKNWYLNKSNQIITFNTENQNIKWQIFSIYTIKNTNDYLYTNFIDDNKYIEFINLIKNRSIYNFNINISANDNILTLSTCYKDSNNRLVIHAKRI